MAVEAVEAMAAEAMAAVATEVTLVADTVVAIEAPSTVSTGDAMVFRIADSLEATTERDPTRPGGYNT